MANKNGKGNLKVLKTEGTQQEEKKAIIGNTAVKVNENSKTVETVDEKADFDLRKIPLGEIAYNQKNKFGIRDIEELAESIKQHGLQHNAVVKEINHPDYKYEFISGERRHRAISLLYEQTGEEKYSYIYCKVITVADELDEEEKLIIANTQTRELNDMERSFAAARLTEIVNERRKRGESFDGKKTRDVVAEMISKEGEDVSPATVQKLISLQKLIPEFKKQVDEGVLGIEKATQFAQMTEDQQKLVFEMMEEGKTLSAKQAKEIKDEFLKKDADNIMALKKVRDQLEIARKESEENREKAEEASIKLQKLENEKAGIQKQLYEANDKLEEYEQIKNKEKKEIEELTNSLREQIQAEVSKELGEQNAEIIKDLQDKLQQAEQTGKELEEEHEQHIKELQQSIDEAREQLKQKTVERNNIDGNKAIISLAQQAKKALSVLLEEVANYMNKEGFELTEDAMKILGEVSQYDVPKKK